MKQWASTGYGLLVIGLLLSACAPDRPAGPPARVRIGTSITFPPFESTSVGQAALNGFNMELLAAIAGKANLEIVYTGVAYDELLSGVADCTLDAAIAAFTPDDRLKSETLFSDPYLTVGQAIVIKVGNPWITGRETLAGQTVGVKAGTLGAQEVAKIEGAQAKVYPLIDQAFSDLTAGLIDAVVTENTIALGYARIRANNLTIVGDTLAFSSYRLAVCGQHPDVLLKLNAGLAAVRADGTLDRLRQQWLLGAGP